MSIRNIMATEIVTVELDDTLAAVKEIFDNTGFHHLLVAANGKLAGVVSDRDLLKALSPNIGTLIETEKDVATLNKRVHQIMSRELVTLPPDASIYDAVHVFNVHTVSCIPVVDEARRPVGIVSWRDIFKAIERLRLKSTPPA